MANPRKFSEKIALHNQKQAEETAAFEKIMREVSDATAKVCGNFNPDMGDCHNSRPLPPHLSFPIRTYYIFPRIFFFSFVFFWQNECIMTLARSSVYTHVYASQQSAERLVNASVEHNDNSTYCMEWCVSVCGICLPGLWELLRECVFGVQNMAYVTKWTFVEITIKCALLGN